MSIEGYVINNSGRGKFIFSRNMYAGQKISLSELYKFYCDRYGGNFDAGFLAWLKDNRLVEGFEIVVENINSSEKFSAAEKNSPEQLDQLDPDEQAEQAEQARALFVRQVHPNKLTARDISELKIKDNPRDIIRSVSSKSKLRRALTLCTGLNSKETIIKYIKERIDEL